jgi:outer membrane protein assembly factor BamB
MSRREYFVVHAFATIAVVCLTVATGIAAPAAAGSQSESPLPTGPLVFGGFSGEFNPDGSFSIEGRGWPTLTGTWTLDGKALDLSLGDAPRGCAAPARYTFEVSDGRLHLSLSGTDACMPRRMILDGSTWRPADEAEEIAERVIRHRAAPRPPALPDPGSDAGSWPSFRGLDASGIAYGQDLPDEWNGETGDGILWKTPIPGLAHSSPVVWGERLFVTSAISSEADATFRPGLYGDGDASSDRSQHRWMIYALDKHSGEIVWERTAYEGAPRDKRHIKSTYASSTPSTDGRIVVAAFGSQGVFAFTVDGDFLWSVDLGRIDLGAYDIPTFEWGPASSPIIWNGVVYLQCDTQKDSFLLALDAVTGETLWKTERDEFSSWGTPTVYEGPAGVELVTNAANFIRGYNPHTGEELWRLGGSSMITAPTPIFTEDFIVVTSGRRPEQPIFVLRPGARGDITLDSDQTTSEHVVWSLQRRGPYMPTPLIYDGILYVLSNNGVFDAYDLESGEEIYRSRVPHLGSGFSSSPVAADGRIYLSNEDGDMVVLAVGREFEHVATNPMGELLMATPAISEGVMYVRSMNSVFAIGTGGP